MKDQKDHEGAIHAMRGWKYIELEPSWSAKKALDELWERTKGGKPNVKPNGESEGD